MLAAGLQALPSNAASTPSTASERSVQAARTQSCDPPTLLRDKLTVVCALNAVSQQRFDVKVHLTGSHDDTTASMKVTLGDAPIDCDVGSKTSTEGEDGDVTLHCSFTASGLTGVSTILRASAQWLHAQYVGFEVKSYRL